MKFRYRVYFTPDGTAPRNVTASNPQAAKRCAVLAERLSGNRARELKPTICRELYPVLSLTAHPLMG